MTRTYSDTILNRIDRNKTFAAVNDSIQPADLLTSVITALGSFRDDEDDGQSVLEMAQSNSQNRGLDLFSDSEILASERTWSGSDANFHPIRRERATSESINPQFVDSGIFGNNEWTWNGTTSVSNEILQMRQRAQPKKRNELFHRAISSNSNRSVTVNIPDFTPETTTTTNNGLLHKLNPFKKRNSLIEQELDAQKYLEATSRGRESRMSLPKQYITSTKNGRPSVYSLSPHREEQEADILETTTIADLIRCLEIVHTKAINSPQRKLGTDSLRPPLFLDRRSSLRPESFNPHRRQSAIVTSTLSPILSPRRFSIRPAEQPPPYSTTNDSPLPFKRRFSVRPSSLAIPPGQAPPPTMLQRKLSIRKPNLLKKSQNELVAAARGPRMRPNSILNSRTRHGSLSSLYERNGESFTRNKD